MTFISSNSIGPKTQRVYVSQRVPMTPQTHRMLSLLQYTNFSLDKHSRTLRPRKAHKAAFPINYASEHKE